MTPPRTGDRSPNGIRTVARLRATLDRKLIGYLAAATTTGLGMLAGTQSAEARVIYTKTTMRVGETVAIDLNRDGTTDISFLIGGQRSYVQFLYATMPPGNGMFGKSEAVPMFFGVPIGPGEDFVGNVDIMGFLFAHSGSAGSGGTWAGKTNRYMGIKFGIGGKTHFGWVRITVANESETITGYAYETIPDKSIKAGDIGRVSAADEPRMSGALTGKPQLSLGLLARGADGLTIWRRE